jgi:hypothetical protein
MSNVKRTASGFRTIRAVGGPSRPHNRDLVTITSVPNWMRAVWAEEARNPRTGPPMTSEEKKQIDENDGSIFEGGEKDFSWL